MLDNGFKYEKEIREKYFDVQYDEKYKFYFSSIYSCEYKQPENIGRSRRFVSLKDGKVIGYISYDFVEETALAYNFGAINFSDEKAIFGKDLRQVIDDIFCKFNMNKLEFNVICGNPIEKSYDRMVAKMGGRIVGYRRDSARLIDNRLYNDKIYEIMRYEYLNFKNKNTRRK